MTLKIEYLELPIDGDSDRWVRFFENIRVIEFLPLGKRELEDSYKIKVKIYYYD